VRQLITRIDDELHEELKVRAAAEGRSLNSLVKDLLARGLSGQGERDRLRAQIEAAGLSVVLPSTRGRVLSRDEAIALTRGWGTAVSDALEADRNHR
jgi:plasmid stability protein